MVYEHIFAGTVVWTKGANLSGVFSTIRIGDTPDKVLVYGVPAAGPPLYDWVVAFDFTSASFNTQWNADLANGNPPTGWVAGVGYQSGISGWIIRVKTSIYSPTPCTILQIDITAGTLYYNNSTDRKSTRLNSSH